MKRIGIVTATRAEYGLLSPLIKELRKYENDVLAIDLIVTGTHLSYDYGHTIEEIDDRIDYKIDIPVLSRAELDISTNQAATLVRFTELFIRIQYDAVILLGDRYETLMIAIATGNTRTPIFHLCGGDTTEGAIDEWIRHSITKMSYLHFVTNKESRERVIQLGENPERVFNYGATGIDNVLHQTYMEKDEALSSIGLHDCKYILCTYHPVTLSKASVDYQITEFLKIIDYFHEYEFVITKSNADQGGSRINELLDAAKKNISNLHVFASFGVKRYLSLMKYAECVIGNSSSGIAEAPALHIPTVNIGDRQKGRLQSESIINCGEQSKDIIRALRNALSNEHKEICQKVISPYGDGHAAERIAKKIVEAVMDGRIDLKKKFYDLKDVYES